MPAQTGNFTLRVMPHNAQNGRGSLPHFMPSMNGDAPKPRCRVSIWNPDRGVNGAWENVSDMELVHATALARAETEKGAALVSGDTVLLVGKSGARWKVDVE